MSSVLVALYTFHSFSPVGVLRFQLRWYHVLAFCIVVFAANRARLSLKAAAPFLLVAGLTVFGAILAPLRVGFSGELLKNTLGITLTLLAYSLLLPVLASERCRRLTVLALLAASLFWLFALRSFVAEMGDGARLGLTGPGQDRNFIAFILGVGMVILLGTGLFWPRRGTPTPLRTVIRVAALAGSLWLLCALPFTFSRSGILVAIFMILGSLAVYALKNRIRGIALPVVLLIIITAVASASIPTLVAQLPSWRFHFERLVNWRTDDAMSGRRDLLVKGALMVRENPIIGVGVGGSKSYILEGGGAASRRGLIHNGYLTAWAELGLPGFSATLLLLAIWAAELRFRIQSREDWALDLVCLLAGGAMIAMNIFIDYGAVYWFIAVLICGQAYGRRLWRVRLPGPVGCSRSARHPNAAMGNSPEPRTSLTRTASS